MILKPIERGRIEDIYFSNDFILLSLLLHIWFVCDSGSHLLFIYLIIFFFFFWTWFGRNLLVVRIMQFSFSEKRYWIGTKTNFQITQIRRRNKLKWPPAWKMISHLKQCWDNVTSIRWKFTTAIFCLLFTAFSSFDLDWCAHHEECTGSWLDYFVLWCDTINGFFGNSARKGGREFFLSLMKTTMWHSSVENDFIESGIRTISWNTCSRTNE